MLKRWLLKVREACFVCVSYSCRGVESMDELLEEMWYQSNTRYDEKGRKCDSIEHAKNDDESKNCRRPYRSTLLLYLSAQVPEHYQPTYSIPLHLESFVSTPNSMQRPKSRLNWKKYVFDMSMSHNSKPPATPLLSYALVTGPTHVKPNPPGQNSGRT